MIDPTLPMYIVANLVHMADDPFLSHAWEAICIDMVPIRQWSS